MQNPGKATDTQIVSCPQCKGPALFAPTNLWRPFCSKRCKSRDFGAWASEEFRLPDSEPKMDEILNEVDQKNLH